MTDDNNITGSETDDSTSNSFAELSDVLAPKKNAEEREVDRPTEEEINELDITELRSKYGPFVDIDIDEE